MGWGLGLGARVRVRVGIRVRVPAGISRHAQRKPHLVRMGGLGVRVRGLELVLG